MDAHPVGCAALTIVLLTSLWPDSPDSPRDQGTFAVYELVRPWAAAHRLVVFRLRRTPWLSRWTVSERDFDGCRVVETPLGPEFFGRSLMAPTAALVARWLRRNGIVPDAVVTHFRSAHLLANALRRRFPGAAHVAGIHQFDLHRLEKRPSYRRCLDRADGIAFRSPSIRDRALRVDPSWAAKGFLALSGVAEGWLAGARPPRRPSDPLTVATVGRLIARKGVHVVLEALSRLESPWHYHVVGDGPERASLETLAGRLGVAGRVTFWGLRTHDEVKAHLDASDVFAMPANKETFGLAYLEAMARGCVVIGSRGWGIDGIVSEGESGFLAEVLDAASVGALLTRLASAAPKEWETWRAAGRRLAESLTQEAASAAYLQFVTTVREAR